MNRGARPSIGVRSVFWLAASFIAGGAFIFASWVVRNRDQWLSDAAMSIGFGLLLVGPALFLTRMIESRAEEKIEEVRSDLSGEVAYLRRSVAESRSEVQARLNEANDRVRSRIGRILSDTSHATVLDALVAARESEILSPLGVRGKTGDGNFFLRLRLSTDTSAIEVELDLYSEPAIASATWLADRSFEDVSVELAEQARTQANWAGNSRWDLATGLQQIVETLLLRIDLVAKGQPQNNVVQTVGNWILSDWDACPIDMPWVQLTFERLDDGNWYKHFASKTWVDESELGEMLDTASFIEDLRSQLQGS